MARVTVITNQESDNLARVKVITNQTQTNNGAKDGT